MLDGSKEDEEQFEIREVEIQPQQVDEPNVGSFYNNIDELFDSYVMYAKRRDCSVAKKSGSKGTRGSFRKYQTIACDREKKSTDNSTWKVSKIVEQHNHELVSSMIQSNVKRKLEANDMAGIRPSKSAKVVIFFNVIEIDEEGKLENIFWVHRRSIATYEEFKDVFRKLYNKRDLWVPVFVNNIFWAGMLSTERSEIMHAFFDGYVHASSTLEQFMEQYEISIRHKVEKEVFADFKSKNNIKKGLTFFEWEKQFQAAYINDIFEKFQKEIKRMWYCYAQNRGEEFGNEYNVDFDEVGFEKIKTCEKALINDWYMKDFSCIVFYKEECGFLNANEVYS
ncbi:hypothetical protein M9H77_20790 [Catharanthus roseus]|uniref:Uncharacterized protein n=1 Tax=Catharanthus roseus TaxID=4058 RepID=A0ACC0AKH5_CATRO|nr:hypothetical protein M9H77_20790 [Catharanthus roseus]